MTVTKAERQRIIDEVLARQKRELAERMAEMGRSRSAAKRKASIENMKKARAAKSGKLLKGG